MTFPLSILLAIIGINRSRSFRYCRCVCYGLFVAVFMYFQTVTLDARTLTVKKREVRRDSVRYHDPNSTAINIGRMFDSGFLSQALSSVVQRSSERAVTGDVTVSPARKLEAPAAPTKP